MLQSKSSKLKGVRVLAKNSRNLGARGYNLIGRTQISGTRGYWTHKTRREVLEALDEMAVDNKAETDRLVNMKRDTNDLLSLIEKTLCIEGDYWSQLFILNAVKVINFMFGTDLRVYNPSQVASDIAALGPDAVEQFVYELTQGT
jgi:hypothetical protein